MWRRRSAWQARVAGVGERGRLGPPVRGPPAPSTGPRVGYWAGGSSWVGHMAWRMLLGYEQ